MYTRNSYIYNYVDMIDTYMTGESTLITDRVTSLEHPSKPQGSIIPIYFNIVFVSTCTPLNVFSCLFIVGVAT